MARRKVTDSRIKCELLDYRKKAKLTLDALGKACGISKSSIFEIEMGNTIPMLSTAYKIAKVLGVKVYDIWPDEIEVEEVTITVRKVKAGAS